MSLRVLLADDHRLFAEGLAALLAKEPGLEVVGTVEDGRAAVKAAIKLAPDVVVMDLAMPRLSGIEAARQIVARRPAIKVLCLSMHRERQYLQAALEAGAAGYVLKDCAPEEMILAIHRVAAGGTHLCPEMTAAAIDEYRGSLAGRKAAIDPLPTPREREVLQLVAEGRTSQEIAQELFLSERTVSSHRRNLMNKLGIHSVAGLTKYAIRQGLTTAERDRRGAPSE
ncbi:MAG: response regulator [bacterium]